MEMENLVPHVTILKSTIPNAWDAPTLKTNVI